MCQAEFHCKSPAIQVRITQNKILAPFDREKFRGKARDFPRFDFTVNTKTRLLSRFHSGTFFATVSTRGK